MSNNNNYDRNKSFGRNNSPKRDPGGPRRSVSHDGQSLRNQFQSSEGSGGGTDDDGFTTIGSSSSFTKKKSGGRFANAAASASDKHNNNTPRGRMNPTSSFTRPRPANSFNKPRPTGSFKKGRDSSGGGFHSNNNNKNNIKQSHSFHHGSSSGSMIGDGGGPRTPNRNQSRSFNKPRPMGSFDSTSSGKSAKQEKYKRSTSRMNSYDVELYLQGDGFTPEQRNVVRIHVDTLMQARLQHLDPPPFGGTITNQHAKSLEDEWEPHHKCLWNDPTRRDQIEQVMQQYPNAIPLSMKKRTRIMSSKLGDSTTKGSTRRSSIASSTTGAASVASTTDGDNSERDDSSVGTSIHSASEQPSGDAAFVFATDQEDMNPLRKTLLLLNKLSWTTIDKLTPKLFEVLEVDVPKLMPPSSVTSSTPPSIIQGGDSTTAAGEGDDASGATNDGGVVPGTDSNTDATTTNTGDNNSSANEQDKTAPATSNNNASTEVSPMVLNILNLLVEKAQTEPHFSAMYATLCRNLAERNGAWKRKILAHCQTEFEHDVAWHTARLDERLEEKSRASKNKSSSMEDISSNTNATEDMDRDYQVLQIRKKYVGHVQFIGELFKLKLIKPDIMIWCLSRLLFHKEEADEDDLECFIKLMTVVGEQAEYLVKKGKCHAVAEEKWYQCWDRVYFLTGRKNQKQSSSAKPAASEEGPPPKISSRIKFMLVDLLELEENGKCDRFQAVSLCVVRKSWWSIVAHLLVFCSGLPKQKRLGPPSTKRKTKDNRRNSQGSQR